MPNDMNQKW